METYGMPVEAGYRGSVGNSVLSVLTFTLSEMKKALMIVDILHLGEIKYVTPCSGSCQRKH